MALSPCKECGKPTAVGAPTCPHCGVTWPAGKPTSPVKVLGLGLVVVMVVAVISLQLAPDTPQPNVASRPVARIDSAAARRVDSIAAAQRVADSAELVAVKRSFTFEPDKIHPEQGWYTHKQQTVGNSWGRIYLDAPVDADGAVYLRSNYYGDDWIFQTSVEARIGNQVISTTEVPSYDPDNDKNNGSGSVWETIHFTKGRDAGLLEALGRAPDSVTVVVRLNGKYSKTFNLSKRDQRAIKQSYRLAELLRARR